MEHYTQTLEDLNNEEQTAVKQLRQRMAGHMSPKLFEDINMFIRFLRARDLNINAAEAMLKKHIEWRKIHQVDEIHRFTPSELAAQSNTLTRESCYLVELSKDFDVIKKYCTFNYIGNDKEGSPILFFNFGRIDSRGLLKSARKVDVTKFIVQKLEKTIAEMHEESVKRGKFIDKWTIIINFDGLSFAVASQQRKAKLFNLCDDVIKKLKSICNTPRVLLCHMAGRIIFNYSNQSLELLGNLIIMYEANYPERLKVACFLNASIYFTMAFGVVKHFLSVPTYRKIKIFGRDGWQEEIFKLIDPEVWPAFLGGNRTDPDGNPLCKTIVTHGGLIPESYYVNKKENSLINEPDIRKLTISRMSKTQLTLNVTEAGSHIEWEFETKSRDIAFSLMYKPNYIDNRMKELIPRQRVDTNVASEAGTFKCDKPGIYIVEFDNSYSWMFQKEVYYKIAVVKNSIVVDK